MATFQIHQDPCEKENTQVIPKKVGLGGGGVVTNKRSTFAVLNNVSNKGTLNVAPSGKAAFRDIAKKNDENYGALKPQNKKTTTVTAVMPKTSSVPIEQFKTFSVYEDKSLTKISLKDEKLDNSGAIRDPLREIPNGEILDSTPMSVSGVLSPMSIMSIDKSQLDILDMLPKNDRERFFEVVEYQRCILEYFRENEKKHCAKANYMKRQPDISYSMRTILVDWLVEVAEEYRLDTETLYLAISYIDRFLSLMSVVRAKLQLVGTAAMYIASKYEEIYPPEVAEFVFITDDTYSKSQVLRMEQIILKILSFDLCVPTSYAYINTYSVLYDMSKEEKFLAQYISELSLLEGDPFLQYMPSQISAASVALARYTLDKDMWSTELEDITSYCMKSLKDIIVKLSDLHIKAVELPQQAIQDKYKSSKYLEVSTIKPKPISFKDMVFIAA